MAVARFQQIGREALKYLDKGAMETLDELCARDPDIVEMFKLINTMRGLGLQRERGRFDIEFPTRNHLKVFLARLIHKRRLQSERGMCDDLINQHNIAIISSTDYCEEKIVSGLCKSVFTPRDDETNIARHLDNNSNRFSPNRRLPGGMAGGFSQYSRTPKKRMLGVGASSNRRGGKKQDVEEGLE